MKMGIVTFSVGGRTYKFKEPLMLESEYIDGMLHLTHKGLSLSASGKSWGECQDIILEELATLWEEYALAPDDALTPGAIVFKKKLLEMVEGAK